MIKEVTQIPERGKISHRHRLLRPAQWARRASTVLAPAQGRYMFWAHSDHASV